VLAREPVTEGMRNVQTLLVPSAAPADWPRAQADTAVVLFDPPRLFYDRERALWTPAPAQLPELARWLRASGVRTLAVVLPHAPGRLPEALKSGLASLDEHAVASLGFERVLILRSAQKPAAAPQQHPLQRLARWMLGVFKYMVPSAEQPVRAVKVAELLALPCGAHRLASTSPRPSWCGRPRRAISRPWRAAGSDRSGTIDRKDDPHAQVQAPGRPPRRRRRRHRSRLLRRPAAGATSRS
jgi:hypothetical protein